MSINTCSNSGVSVAYITHANARLIDSALPGLAYVRVEGSPSPVRVRAAFPTDADITVMADGYGFSGAVES